MERDQFITRLRDALQGEREKVRRGCVCVRVRVVQYHVDTGDVCMFYDAHTACKAAL